MTAPNSRRKIRKFKDEPLRPGDPRVKPKGTLLVIGGHEDKEHEKIILRTLARRVGDGKLVIASLASESPNEIWETYEPLMRSLGVRHVHHLKIAERVDGESLRAMNTLEGATAVFFTGGDQMRITSMIGDTPVFSRIVEIFANGGTIAGTSAGASVLSDTMLVDGRADESHRIGASLRLAPGFGFARDMVIDQHFAERGRISRLLGVVAQNPRVLGIGIDENTAIELQASRGFRVIGAGAVTVVNGATVTETNIAEEETDRTASIFNVTLHLLSQGDSFDLRTRTPKMGSTKAVEEELGIDEEDKGEAADDD
jgi:cyanophycinase